MPSGDYADVNKATFNALSDEYELRMSGYAALDRFILKPLINYLLTTFSSCIRIIDIGPGTGLDLAILAEEGSHVTGVDVAEEMLKLSRRTCPEAVLIYSDVRVLNFFENSFEAVLAKASLHFFKKSDAIAILEKSWQWLAPRGMMCITTTLSEKPEEGFQAKSDYSRALVRYRKRWTEAELVNLLADVGFSILEKTYDKEEELGKQWVNVYAIKDA